MEIHCISAKLTSSLFPGKLGWEVGVRFLSPTKSGIFSKGFTVSLLLRIVIYFGGYIP